MGGGPGAAATVLLSGALLAGWGVAAGQASDPSLPEKLSALSVAAEQTDPLPELVQLTEGFGPRLTGSRAVDAAGKQVLERMRAMGLENVHAESWVLPRSWRRGFAHVTLRAPFTLAIPMAAYGWSGSTPPHGGAVRVVSVNANQVAHDLDGLVGAQAASWRGRVLLVSSDVEDPLRLKARLLPLLRAATAAHAVAVLLHDPRPGSGLVHTEPVAIRLPVTLETGLIPALDLSMEHQRLLEDLLRSNRRVTLDIDVRNECSKGPVSSANLVGEIVGSQHPQEVVVVGAHLDSWDLGLGAMDDGFGVAAVLGAAHTVLRAGLRPARTLRFVLFTGEEQGLLGSRAYVQRHAAELGEIVAAFALDWGAGPIVQFPTAGHPELLPLLARFNDLTPGLHLDPPTDGWLFMTDAYAFTLAGFFLADADNVPAAHFTPAETAAALIRGKQRAVLETLGMWPFRE